MFEILALTGSLFYHNLFFPVILISITISTMLVLWTCFLTSQHSV